MAASQDSSSSVSFSGRARQLMVLVNDSLQLVTLPPSAGVPVTVSVGDQFYGVVTADGQVFMGGDNESGQAGSNGPRKIDLLHPQRVQLAIEEGGAVSLARSLATGMRFTIVRTDRGAQSFGGNDYKQLGRPQQVFNTRQEEVTASLLQNEDGSVSIVSPHHGAPSASGYLPPEVAKAGVRSVACGLHVGFVVSNDGDVYACGHAGFGLTEPKPDVGSGDYWTFTERLTRVPMPERGVRIVTVAAEHRSAFALTEDGHVIEWGTPPSNAAAMSGWDEEEAPTLVMPTQRTDVEGVEAITAMACSAYALVRKGAADQQHTEVYSLRLNKPAELINGSKDVVRISYNLALRADGTVLKTGADGYEPEPKLIAPPGYVVVDVANGRCGMPMLIVEAVSG